MDMSAIGFAVIFLVIVALAFDFINGMHDSANSIATIVSTRVLKPQYAVAWAAFFNFAAYYVATWFGFEAKVANTIGKGLIDPALVDNAVVFGALLGAIAWNLITWYFGIPSSSPHALVGGIIGAGVAKVGVGGIVWSGLNKTLWGIVLSPFTGFILGIVLLILVLWLFIRANPAFADGVFRKLQLVSSALYSIGHGSNDAQKTAGAITLFGATHLGIPVSTTHTITSSIVGVGAARRASAVRWGIAGRIVWAWVITIPASGIIAVAGYWLGRLLF